MPVGGLAALGQCRDCHDARRTWVPDAWGRIALARPNTRGKPDLRFSTIRRERSYYDKLGLEQRVAAKAPGMKGWAFRELINFMVAQGQKGLS
ncbi:MAG TPA: hypothetical protein VEH31_37635 [Streptosporangiaceae bacterium]|nr:hypothetical protein [Streptosporangiaceae bacterium]